MALFRSDTGMHLLALPTTSADTENTYRKNIVDAGTVSAARMLSAAGILPRETLVCGPPGRTFPVIEALQQQSRLPFVLIGTKRDLTASPLLRLPVQWESTTLPAELPEGSGRITIRPADFGMDMMQLADWGGSHLILLCLGQGLSATAELMDHLNAAGHYVLIASTLSRAVSYSSGGLSVEALLRSMHYLIASTIGGEAETLLHVLPTYESEKVTNSLDFNAHRDRGGMMGRHSGRGLSLGQNREVVTKPVLTQDDLARLRSGSEFLVYNQDLLRLWVGKIS